MIFRQWRRCTVTAAASGICGVAGFFLHELLTGRITAVLEARGLENGQAVPLAARLVSAVRILTGARTFWRRSGPRPGGCGSRTSRRPQRGWAIVVPLALFLIFVLLYTALRTVKLAAMIFLSVLLAATGGIVALYLSGMPFSISAGVGFIALFGVAVLNGVVLMSYINRMREQGVGTRDATLQGAEIRLRPVLMTALVLPSIYTWFGKERPEVEI